MARKRKRVDSSGGGDDDNDPRYVHKIKEDVMAFHGPLLYKAKVLQRRINKSDKPQYKVHYDKWNKRWDEWVDLDRLFPLNDETIAMAKKVEDELNAKAAKESAKKTPASSKKAGTKKPKVSTQKKPSASKSSSAKSGSSASSSSGEAKAPKPKKRKIQLAKEDDDTVDMTSEQEEQVRMRMPPALKHMLTKDWQESSRKMKLTKVPVSENLTVKKIVEEYQTEIRNRQSLLMQYKPAVVQEFSEGIINYFELSLRPNLLYLTEVPQWEDLTDAQRSTPSEVYGILHLIRLFVKLPFMLARLKQAAEDNFKIISCHLKEFLQYLDEHHIARARDIIQYEDMSDEYRQRIPRLNKSASSSAAASSKSASSSKGRSSSPAAAADAEAAADAAAEAESAASSAPKDATSSDETPSEQGDQAPAGEASDDTAKTSATSGDDGGQAAPMMDDDEAVKSLSPTSEPAAN